MTVRVLTGDARALLCEITHADVVITDPVSLIDAAAVAKVLIAKGIISELEYFTAVRDLWRADLRRYEAEATASTGRPVEFG